MAKSTPAENPWISKRLFDALQTRTADAEKCLTDLLTLMRPEWREEFSNDWLVATKAVLGSCHD